MRIKPTDSSTLQSSQTLLPAVWLSILWKPAYLIVVTGTLYLFLANWSYDDPYITYRYADNLFSKLGFVYNPGERVLSTTTPLFALLLAVLKIFWQDLPRLANLVGAFSLALSGLFLWELGRTWKSPLAGWAGLTLYPTFPLLTTTLGSEMPTYLAFCLGAFLAYANRRLGWTAIFSALAILTRADGALVPMILGVDHLVRRRQPIPWGSLALFLGLVLPWYVFAWVYFGSPIPATLAAKQQQGGMAISQSFSVGIVTIAKWYMPFWQIRAQILLFTLGTIYIWWRERQWITFWLWAPVYFLAYSALGVSRYFWYYATLVPGIKITAGLGQEAIAKALSGALGGFLAKSHINARGLSTAGVWLSTGLVAMVILVPMTIAQAQQLWGRRQVTDSRAEIYKAIGEWLRTNTDPDDTVGTLEVGIIGYHAQRPMVDFAGLIQPQVAAQLNRDTTFEDTALWATEHHQPDYLVLQDGLFPRLEAGFVQEKCQIVLRLPGETYQFSEDMVVYHCPP